MLQGNPRDLAPWLVAAATAAPIVAAAGAAHGAELAQTRLRLGQVIEEAEPEGASIAAILEPSDAPGWLTWLGEDVHYALAFSGWREASRDSDDVFTVHFGPTWHYEPDAIAPLVVEIGTAPTLMSEDALADRDIGGHFQFTSHVTLGTRLGERQRWQAGVRLQHVSNAGIEDENPGLNVVMVELGYRFSAL